MSVLGHFINENVVEDNDIEYYVRKDIFDKVMINLHTFLRAFFIARSRQIHDFWKSIKN